jgi:hypothetical protein
MVTDLIEAAKKEEAELAALLKSNAIYKKLIAVRNLLECYQGTANEKPKAVTGTGSGSVAPPKKDLVEKATTEFLRGKGPTHSAVIHQYLLEKGIDVPLASLSAYLSRARDQFISDRSKGWSLVQNNTEIPSVGNPAEESKTPEAATSGAGSDALQNYLHQQDQGEPHGIF